ncbi:hypothetical protein AGABI1DRAFT_116585 [Agaricus bisporus var. burnettii JB137-S8]|nr:uncharacterized protein AGABI1DRAFT_116585 [Agaricus bisporus var. burnettii JB137-S8]EKM75008.1 hypothetical protein AGABI1DRAFT_116585 [Agaricus bisporus var. burnettii JB137-S8]
MISFYDLTAKPPFKTVSVNSWKIRYALNFKNLPYKTLYFEFPDMAKEFSKVGIPPSSVSADGPSYTVPSLIDDSTNTRISESFTIALYLDKQYPDTPKLFPAGTEALQAAFHEEFYKVMSPTFPFFFPKAGNVLNKPSDDYFAATRAKMFGMSMADFEPKGEARVEAWKKVKDAFDTLESWMKKTPGPFFMGETVSFADFVIGGLLNEFSMCMGEDSQEWQDVLKWNNGRWATLKKKLEVYANTDQ